MTRMPLVHNPRLPSASSAIIDGMTTSLLDRAIYSYADVDRLLAEATQRFNDAWTTTRAWSRV